MGKSMGGRWVREEDMKRSRTIITKRFLKRICLSGALACAAERQGSLVKACEPLPNLSTWELVCEEVLDTEHSPEWCDRMVAELFRRGVTPIELEQMRVFAWETAGWLNFEKMVWDWCSLDESNIRRAIDWQFKEAEIDEPERDRRLTFMQHHARPSSKPGSP